MRNTPCISSTVVMIMPLNCCEGNYSTARSRYGGGIKHKIWDPLQEVTWRSEGAPIIFRFLLFLKANVLRLFSLSTGATVKMQEFICKRNALQTGKRKKKKIPSLYNYQHFFQFLYPQSGYQKIYSVIIYSNRLLRKDYLWVRGLNTVIKSNCLI